MKTTSQGNITMKSLLGLLLAGTCALAQPIPGMLDLTKVKVSIHDVVFVTELSGTNGTYKEKQPEKYHGVVITLRITKDVASSLTIHAQDLVLHYRRGEDNYDVAKCIGLSVFSSSLDVDRPMTFFDSGLGKMTTGAAMQKADVVYIDAFYQFMEPETREIYLLVAQPAGLSLRTHGWSH
jgi:hypothetical protein